MKNFKLYVAEILFFVCICFQFGCDSGGSSGGGASVSPNLPVPVNPTNLCTDLNSSNTGASLPCTCNLGYTLSTDGKSWGSNLQGQLGVAMSLKVVFI